MNVLKQQAINALEALINATEPEVVALANKLEIWKQALEHLKESDASPIAGVALSDGNPPGSTNPPPPVVPPQP